jgi:molybdenum cofactor cytidylyltransferase
VGAAINANIGPVVVVIGANETDILADLKNEDIATVINKDLAEGLSSSIKTGLKFLLTKHQACEDALLMVCDQPFVNEVLLEDLRQKKIETNKPLIACSYKDTIGVPALFDKQFFDELFSLKGEEGGKKVLFNNPHAIATIPFPDGAIDIDTISDYEALIK